MDYVMAFLIGGLICAVGQILMDATKLTPAHILVLFVTLGAVLSGLGLYQPLVEIGKAGATIPLTGFGHTLVTGVIEDVNKRGFLGIFTGGLTSAAAGITAAVVFGYLMAVLFNPKSK
ncbi:MAG: stage sporulation protein [Thermoanaerobacteraceae bacterium]|jgi:stage V sporulation protein AE|uniref:Stage V sporulation protein AE n=1 Tax=Biomaibacter acetigenes TaxID=2316383 RepID=A0A3G2R5J6_9FIRM|nr:stage V sporulation protein AE [Biomaibacter acetigenes]MDK2878360.1 stage sporulation protein [Thermoanaerobacteraceae bacterium]RKL64194.1 stage V sporulation protein AE [Thermoanaerobacteraceae bacterium SP2]AYO30682.1 stage V sporulation protein AE [Biomaibacter acetigenes]MDN5300699.1 stage sporulation protein [Thermoanaerobacteraceae bacterium]MDN5311411.1 stage sporulation protein [Thermoanaerobacteraceae bacterium]